MLGGRRFLRLKKMSLLRNEQALALPILLERGVDIGYDGINYFDIHQMSIAQNRPFNPRSAIAKV